MVETPLRRSRRIRSQSDDEASVASSTHSRGSRGSSASSTSATPATPTRRSARKARTPRTAKGARSAVKKGMESIPESITAGGERAVDDAVVSPPATAAKPAKKKEHAATEESKITKQEILEASKEATTESQCSTSPAPKSSKKKRSKKSTDATVAKVFSSKVSSPKRASESFEIDDPTSSLKGNTAKLKGKKENVEGDDVAVSVQIILEGTKEEETTASHFAVSSSAPPSTKTKIKSDKKLMDVEESVNSLAKALSPPKSPVKSSKAEGAVSPQISKPIDLGDVTVSKPVKSAKKNRKKDASVGDTTAMKQGKREESKDETMKIEMAASPPAPSSTSAKSPKKKKRSESSMATVAVASTKMEAVLEAKIVAPDGEVDDAVAATPSQPTNKKKNQNATEKDSIISEQGNVETTKQEIEESKGATSPSAPASARSSKKKKRSEQSMATVDDADVATPLKSTKKKKNQNATENHYNKSEQGKVEMTKEEVAKSKGANSLSAPASARSSKKKKRSEQSMSTVAGDSSKMGAVLEAKIIAPDGVVDDAVVATPSQPTKKKKNQNAMGKHSNISEQGKVKMTKEEIAELKGATSTLAPASARSSKKKKRSEQPMATVAGDSSKVEVVLEAKIIAPDGAVDDAVVATPSQPTKKTKNQNAAGKYSNISEQGNVETTKEEMAKSKGATSPSAPASARSLKRKKRSEQPMATVAGDSSKMEAVTEENTPDGVVDDALITTPPISVEKEKNQNTTDRNSTVKKQDEIEMAQEGAIRRKGVSSSLAPTPSKSLKKKKHTKQGATEAFDVSSAEISTPRKLVDKSPKAEDGASPSEEQLQPIANQKSDTKEGNKLEINHEARAGDGCVETVAATPPKSAKKNKKEKVTEIVSLVEEQGKAGGTKEAAESADATFPSAPASTKGSKKSRNAGVADASSAKLSIPKTSVKHSKLEGAAPAYKEEPQLPTTPLSGTKKGKETEGTPMVSMNSVAADAAKGEYKATVQEKMKMTAASAPASTKSPKKRKKKCQNQLMGAEEEADLASKTSDGPGTPNIGMKRRQTKIEPAESDGKPSRATEAPAETKKSRKKRKKKPNDGDAVDVSFETISKPTGKFSSSPSEEQPPAEASKLSKWARKRQRKSELEKAKDDPLQVTPPPNPTSTKKSQTLASMKKSKKKTHSEEKVTSAAAGESSKTVDVASPKDALKKLPKGDQNEPDIVSKKSPTSREGAKKTNKGKPDVASAINAIEKLPKSNQNEPEIISKKSPKQKKKAKKTNKADKSSTKKQVPHKKQQSHKHGRPEKGRIASRPPSERPKLVMDVKVHRLRFLKLHPKSVMAMASTPLHLSSGNSDQRPRPPARLAISREGGAVELLSPQDRWVSIGDVPGVRGREVDALVWVCGRRGKEGENNGSKVLEPSSLGSQQSHSVRIVDGQRHLFGCSRDGTIFELDFATKRQKGVIGSGGGGVFCLSSMCSRANFFRSQGSISDRSCGGYFAAGCEDGTVKIYSIFGPDGRETASGMPELVATLPSAGDAILSLAWVPGQSGNDDGGMGGSLIFAGVADGTIRRYDCTTATATGPISTGTVLAPSRGSVSVSYRWKSTLRMTVENRGLRESTKVWALEALSDGTVISGDSLGHVQMWDGMSGTMTQTFDHNESGADVLCLAVSEDENKIFASGVDSSVRCIQRQSLSTEVGNKSPRNVTFDVVPSRNWISSTSHRKHSHDVKALAICQKETSRISKPLELLVSGSIDTRICTYVATDFKSSRPKIWYNWPTLSPLSVSSKQRFLAVTRENGIDLFQLKSPEMADPLKNMNPETRDETNCLVKTISIQSPFNLSCSVISDDGKFLAASDALSLYVFSLEVEDEDGVLDVHPTRLSLPGECQRPATALQFDDTGRLICATSNGPINILCISKTNASGGNSYIISLDHVFKEHMMDWSASSHHFPVVCLDLSYDGKWFAAGRFSSGKGAVHVFTLDGDYRHWWSLPKMDAPTTCIKFLGGGSVESSLAVGCSNNEFYIYNLGRRSLSHWSNDMGLPLLKSLPKELMSRSEPVARIVSNPVTPQKFILGSHGYFCAVDLDQPVPERSTMFPPDHLRAKRLQLIKEDDTMIDPPKRKTKSNLICEASTNFTICLRYSEILFQDFIAENEMIIVEEPWTSVLEELPDALVRRVYGT